MGHLAGGVDAHGELEHTAGAELDHVVTVGGIALGVSAFEDEPRGSAKGADGSIFVVISDLQIAETD